MTTPSEQQPREAAFFRAIREWGLTRGDNGFLGGVVDGLAQRVGMATVPARIIVVIAALILNGLLLLTYAAAWALLPDRRGNIIIQNFGRGMPNVSALIGIAIFTLFGMSGLDNSGPFNYGNFSFSDATPWSVIALIMGILVPLAFIGAVIWFIVTMARRPRNPVLGQPAAAPSPQGAPAAAGTTENDAPAPATEPASAPASSQPTAAALVYAAMPTPWGSASRHTPVPLRSADWKRVP
ncbi:MAG TPA: PspC domain-containing protein, partial [Demequina sp.]|nr:PspC domain-containing protein [Demequina sp.]